MKLKLRNRTNGNSHNIPRTPHGDTLRELVSVQRKLDSLEAFPACKLTAEAYLRETLEADPNASMQGVKKLRASLAKHPPSLAHTQRALASMLLDLRGTNYPRPPGKYPHRLVTSFGRSPECVVELGQHHTSIVELFAVAVMMTAERHPDLFGTATSSAEYAAEVDALKARRDELYKQADSQVGTEDLVTPDDPKVPMSFKASGGQVLYAPKQDANQRLVNFLMQQRENS